MFLDAVRTILQDSGFAALTWQHCVMIVLSFVLIYLAIAKKFEPLLLLPIAFGMLLANLPVAGLMAEPAEGSEGPGGLLYYLYQGVKLGIYPSLIFLGIGAMTDFGPLIARPSSLFMGAGAQFGIAAAFMIALATGLFTPQEAASIGIIGG
ncbi:MAG: sodium ion-translocating decarboxylase subunit beta, partial [Clostridiaceae bacterium]|nr:sodium ion-translocating decarboxylase subunit beta [Clostridiaceae bacterium]